MGRKLVVEGLLVNQIIHNTQDILIQIGYFGVDQVIEMAEL